MESSIRDKKLSLSEELLNCSGQFSFDMAAYILEFGAKTSFGKETNPRDVQFRTYSINSFHLRGTEIEKISQSNGIPVIYTERLSVTGLNAPLPTPYAELIFRRHINKDIAISSFVNIFNTRILGISYQISKRRYLNLQQHNGTDCLLLKTIAAFFGEKDLSVDRKMARLSYLFWTKEKSSTGLEAIISSCFLFSTTVDEFQTFLVNRTEVCQLKNIKLGKNSELGARFPYYRICINLTHHCYDKIFCLLTNKKYLDDFKFLIKKYLGNFVYFILNVVPQSVPELKMGRALLGRTSWIPGKKYDSVKIIC